MNAKTKNTILSQYKRGMIQNTKDITDLALSLGLSFAEVYRLLCKEERSGSVCEDCVHIGTNKCLHCSRNNTERQDYYELSM